VAGTEMIPSRIIPPERITGDIDEQSVAENFADGKKPGRKGLAKRMGGNFGMHEDTDIPFDTCPSCGSIVHESQLNESTS